MFKFIATLRDPERWLARLPVQGAIIDGQFTRALRRGAHLPTARRSWLPWRRPEPEMIQVTEKRVPPAADPVAAIERVVDTLLGDARTRAHDEVARHIAGLPRGQERAAKFAPLVAAHELRTTRVLETEMRRERRVAGQLVPDVDHRARLVGEMRALEAELSAERTAETFRPLTEHEVGVRQGQLALVRLLLDMDNSRADLMRRRADRPSGSAPATGSDDGGNLATQSRQRGIEIEL